MPPFNWRVDSMDLIRSFEARHKNPESGALFCWAVWAVDSLHYLDDIDRNYDTSHAAIGGHRPDVVDVAHARYGLPATSITALDLCAAGLGRAFCQQQGKHELDLADFAPNQDRRKKLPSLARKWVDAVHADPQYKTIKQSRNFLTHSRILRHFTLAPGPPQRLQLELDGTKVEVRQLIEAARDCATRHVAEFIEKLPQL